MSCWSLCLHLTHPQPGAPTSRAGSSSDGIVPTKAQNLRLKLDLPVALCFSRPPAFVLDLSFYSVVVNHSLSVLLTINTTPCQKIMTVLNDFIKVNCRLCSVNTGAAQTPHPSALSRPARAVERGRLLDHEKGSCLWDSKGRRSFGSTLHHRDKRNKVWEVKPLVSGHIHTPNGRARMGSGVM